MNVVISGASKGIGLAIAKKYAGAGHNVAICSRSMEKLQSAKAEIKSLKGGDVYILRTDVSKKEEVLAFAEFCLKELGQVNILVNNAGYYLPGNLYNEAEGTLENMINTNLYSAYHLTRALVPAMMEQGSGDIVNICSVASINAYPNGGAYSVSKFALHGFSQNLREEMKNHGIRVISVLPGAVLTDSWAGYTGNENRLMGAEDIADAVFSATSLSRRTVVEDIILRPQLGDL